MSIVNQLQELIIAQVKESADIELLDYIHQLLIYSGR